MAALTVDATGYTVDTINLTADQTQITAAGVVPLTADTTAYTADSTNLTADQTQTTAVVVGVPLTADTTHYTADSTYLTADQTQIAAVVGIAAAVHETAAALDALDAAVIPGVVAIVGGGAFVETRRRPIPVEGFGYGVLPQLEGEAYGTVGAIGTTSAQLAVRANVLGNHGSAGAAIASLRIGVTGCGAQGVRGNASGALDLDLNGALIGQYDDDEAALMTLLLAA